MFIQNKNKFRTPKAPFNTNQQFGQEPNVPREDSAEGRLRQSIENDRIDELYGFVRVNDSKERTGFLLNMHSTEVIEDDKRLVSAVDYYFMEEDGTRFKISLPYNPYFYVLCKKDTLQEVATFLQKKYPGFLAKVYPLTKEDLDLPNHLIGLKQKYLKLTFTNMTDLVKVRREIMSAVKKNKEREKSHTYYTEMLASSLNVRDHNPVKNLTDHMDNILDIREYDVPFHVRVSIDVKVFVGKWYTVKSRHTEPPIIICRDDIIERPDPIVLAYDIETTKLPLKFPDVNTDQIMMISYMIDGQGYLITNREIISKDIESFEYTPKPEFEGFFTIYNEPNEEAVIRKFFAHINDVKPHIFVTYNGDFFDWPFVETRAAIHNIDMKKKIGFSKNRDGVYTCRPAMHMDCLCWVKRDSYLPVGSQNLKAVAKAKLRYDPVELDPEEMCRMACEQPHVLANYSVSDAVATYYLYLKYVHPFIFALCTIIPMEPDEVLRKGSGTLCESLLMVEAFHANIIFPNKQETQLNKLTADGHVLDQETYVGGHVEALESGVFRADIPCRFKMVPEAFNKLIDGVEKALKHTIEEEEKIPLEKVTNFDEVVEKIKVKLRALRDQPLRMENPVIYHLDVGAMYPNIILTNRLQPSAMVDETVCAACDYNKLNAVCQRNMTWMWRGEHTPASLSEFQRIQQQLEIEKFPPLFPGGPQRAFHQLSKEDQAMYEKKRLTEYCRKAYKKTKITRMEERTQTVCQKENSFYVDTVRAFRDRRYEYKALTKVSKQQVSAAVAKGDAGEIKSAKNREILYDSLQLAHKCILNSFYGYVMRKGSRWYSMEMGGIVCYTGAHIIKKAREIIEQVGRPLELDTDGIWCVLPASFPDNEIITTTDQKKSKITISYPNAVLNFMVKEEFTNHAYHDLVDSENLVYEVRSENSIFFEVDGPYLAMVLPASKEEGKKLKKRYAVFNFDGSLAELKGFEVKRRGELQLVKIFQSSVFESFLKGDTLEKCYASVAKIADHWLEVLYTKGANMPDTELFDLISENRSMSRKLEEYGAQKSTSISTAKRLAEFLGDQMVKDAGLACKFIISRKPEGAPVTERAIPLAIFQSDPNVKRYYLRKWLKDPSIQNADIRDVLDWNYYIERLGSTIQKIITIPAAMQGVANPVPRVKHPDWLHKKMLEKDDVLKQRRINEMFVIQPKKVATPDSDDESDSHDENEIRDIEDIAGGSDVFKKPVAMVNKRKRAALQDEHENNLNKSWKEVLGLPPPLGNTIEEKQAWIQYQKKKWAYQANQRNDRRKSKRSKVTEEISPPASYAGVVRNANTSTMGGFLRRAQRALFDTPWQIIEIAETTEPGLFRLWALVGQELQQLRLIVPRIFYVNSRKVRPDPTVEDLWRKCSRILPRSRIVYNLYQYSVPESNYKKHGPELMADLSCPNIEGIYETQMPLQFRAILQLGCICVVDRSAAADIKTGTDTFHLNQLQFKSIATQPYLERKQVLKHIFLYHHWSAVGQKAMWGLFLAPTKRAYIFVLDSVRTNQMPNMNTLYVSERNNLLNSDIQNYVKSLPDEIQFNVRVETDLKQVQRLVQSALQAYKNEKKGPTLLAIQSPIDISVLSRQMPVLTEFPMVNTHIQDMENLYSTLDWQRVGAKAMIRHYLKSDQILDLMIQQCRYFHAPIGNLPADPTIFGADLFYARHLQKHNFVLWCSPTERPDLGGSENDDNRLLTDFEESSSCAANNAGTYSSTCVELDVESLAVNTLLQCHRVNDIEGTSTFVAFDNMPQASLQEIVSGGAGITAIPSYDETALCSAAFKVLKTMVNSWLRDISEYRNVFADYQVIHFYRWLRSPSALLYDPALRRTLHNLMKKLFIQLVAEFRRLGSIIIFANFNKIILCSKKRLISDALGYVEFVVKSIKNKELFHSIEITYQQCWEYLIWLDLPNHAGVKGKIPDELRGNQYVPDTEPDEEDDDDGPEIIMNWNLIEYLPEEAACQASFNAIVAGYISAVYQHMSESESSDATPRRRKRKNSSLSQTLTAPLGLGALESTAEFAKKIISSEMSHKLFQIVQKIHKKLPEKILTREENPYLDFGDAESKKINPALELVKSICKVLSLDKEVEAEVHILKRNLLRLIGVGNFGDSAEWSDPCVSFTLPEVICKACYHTRDIDLCKDNDRAFENNRHVWKCPLCETSYDNAEIEFSLIDTLNRKCMGYILQDLQCVKCNQIKRENMNEYCTCAGQYRTLISKRELVRFAKTAKSIAIKFGMPILAETVQNTHLITS
ncbi:DNA polymerase epsilon catalytic subunit 1 isoform X1 [Neodiprion pinetum]|uniref:DNA polymerase epsilon catalytic subunit 1 isoform X1 n=1 Tax=Neodiprion pinetum TaxID=441929 RepID=UPI001EDDFDDE|nr:DNA polymerase epsilon catalytic subunit 1 isoform X1 [Neodiprion pinetum]